MGNYDRRELTDDKGVLMRVNNEALQSGLWTALPGIITKWDAAKQTCEVQPSIKARVLNSKGVWNWVQLPLLVDCPVVFPSGGGFTLTFPIAKDDEVLVIFSSRCIDSWWQSGGIQVQAELRMHDLSDGFAIPGPKSIPKVLPSVSTTDVQLRNFTGDVHIGIRAAGTIDLTTPGKLVAVVGDEATVTAPKITLNGDVTINGKLNVQNDVLVVGKVTAVDFATPGLPSYKVHNHGGVTTGSGYTNVPVPGS